MDSNPEVCRKVNPGCRHECGIIISTPELHICPGLCQKRIMCLDPNGHEVFLKCGEESIKVYAACAELKSLIPSVKPNNNVWKPSGTTGERFPVIHLQSRVPETADSISGQTTPVGRHVQAHFERTETPLDNGSSVTPPLHDPFIRLWSEFPEVLETLFDDILANQDIHWKS